MIAVVSNRGCNEAGVIKRKWKRKGVTYFNVHLERGHLLENITEDTDKPCHLLNELTMKINKLNKT